MAQDSVHKATQIQSSIIERNCEIDWRLIAKFASDIKGPILMLSWAELLEWKYQFEVGWILESYSVIITIRDLQSLLVITD